MQCLGQFAGQHRPENHGFIVAAGMIRLRSGIKHRVKMSFGATLCGLHQGRLIGSGIDCIGDAQAIDEYQLITGRIVAEYLG